MIIIIMTISKSFRKCLNNTTVEDVVKDCRKQPYWALHIFREVLNAEVQNIQLGKCIICYIYCKYRVAATLYTLEAWFVSSI